MLKTDERHIYFLDAKIISYAKDIKGIPPKPDETLIQLIEGLRKDGKALRSNRKDTETVYLSDIKLDKASGFATLLLNRSDKSTADPTFTDLKNETRRVVKKKDEEGQDNSAHIVWKLKEQQSRKDTYLFLMELSPRLSRAKVESFLNFLLSECAKKHPENFTIKHPDGSVDDNGNPQKLKFKSKIELRGHVSETFKEDLEAGKLLGIDVFTKPKEKINWDSGSFTIEKKEIVQIVPSKDKQITHKFRIVKQVLKKANKKNYELATIRFKNEFGDEKSAVLDTEFIMMANDFKYVKKSKISHFKNLLLSSYSEINPEISNKMIELAKKYK